MYSVFLTNFGYSTEARPETLDDAIVEAQRTGFECRIEDNQGRLIATYSPINGVRNYTDEI